MSSSDDSLLLGSVCSPPEKPIPKRTYVTRCPGCGSRAFWRIEGGGFTCSPQCEKNYLKKKEDAVIVGPKKLTKGQKRRFNQGQLRENPNSPKVKNLTHLYPKEAQPLPEPKKKLIRKVKFLKEKFGDSFYTSRAWVELRYEVLKRDGRVCRVCGNGPKDGAKVHVDHIKPRSKYPKLALDITNLQVLCRDCNMGKINKDEIDWR